MFKISIEITYVSVTKVVSIFSATVVTVSMSDASYMNLACDNVFAASLKSSVRSSEPTKPNTASTATLATS